MRTLLVPAITALFTLLVSPDTFFSLSSKTQGNFHFPREVLETHAEGGKKIHGEKQPEKKLPKFKKPNVVCAHDCSLLQVTDSNLN